MEAGIGGGALFGDWSAYTALAPDRKVVPHEVMYSIRLAPGTSVDAYIAAVRAADPGLYVWSADSGLGNPFTVSVVTISVAFSLMIATVSALGVFNTVILNTRERRRDLGMLKSIGMTPRQVTVMVVTSMAALGALGGLLGIPLGIVAHRLIMPAMAHAAQVAFPDSMLDVFPAPMLTLLVLAGIG